MIIGRFPASWLHLVVFFQIAAVGPTSLAAQSPVTTLFAWEDTLAGDEENRLQWPTVVAAGAIDEIAVVDAAGPSLWIVRDLGGAEGWVTHTLIELPATVFSLACGATDRYLISTRRPGRLLAVMKSDYSVRELSLPPEIVPGAIACATDDRLLLHDLAAGRVLLLDAGLGIQSSTAVDGAVAALAAGPGGGFYATFPESGEVRRYGANGDLLGVMAIPGLPPAPAWPVGLIVEANGEILVADRHGGRILVLAAGGRLVGTGSRQGWEPGLLRFPSDIGRLPDGRVVVADQGNGRVQVFARLDRRELP